MVGCGSIGRRHIGNFKAAGIEVSGVDVRQDRLDQAEEEHGLAHSYQDYKEALQGERFDAVGVAVPPHLHLDVCKAAVEQNCHLFIEKPLGMSTEGWLALDRACEKKGLVTFVAYCHRFAPSVQEVKNILDEERIGRLLSAQLRFASYLPDWHPWEDYRGFYMAKKDQGGGALLDESHGTDLLRWFLGEVDSVSATVDQISDLEISSDDVACMVIRFESGAVATAQFDLFSRAPQVQLELTGTDGNIIWDREDSKVEVYDADEDEWEVSEYASDDLLKMYPSEVDHFINCVRNDEEALIDISDGLKTLEVLNASFESSKYGCDVNV